MNKFLALSLALVGSVCSSSAVAPLWLRDVKIAPDGSQIAFTYKGDIYKVPASGGNAVRLTSQPSYESSPVWSPDGKKIAFASDRFGNFDVFLMDAEGGAAKRLTFNSASEIPSAFSADGRDVLYMAAIQDPYTSAQFPRASLKELYKVPVSGGRSKQVSATPAEAVSVSRDGDFWLFHDQKGMENEWRKHHTSSITRDIWKFDVASGKYSNLTNHAGEDRDPVISHDGSTMYFLSERDGKSFNVFSAPIDDPSNVSALTEFSTHPVRFLSLGGNSLCFTFDGEIYTMPIGGKPQKVNINLLRDDDDEFVRRSISSGASSASVSPDGKQICFIVNGDLFVTSVEFPTTKRISNTPALEVGGSFSKDNRSIAYASEVSGNWQLHIASIARADDPNFPNATIINDEVVLPSSSVERCFPKFSPDGKKLAFIEDRNKLMVMDVKSKAVHQVTDGSLWYSTSGFFNFEWSPDGKWFVLEVINHERDPYTDIAVVSSNGGEVKSITNSAYFCADPYWVLDGNAIMFTSNRYGLRSHASWGSQEDVFLAFVNQDAFDKFNLSKEDYELRKELEKEQKKKKEDADKAANNKKKKNSKSKSSKKSGKDSDSAKTDSSDIVVDLDNIEDKIVRVTPNSSSLAGYTVTKDGEKLYYISSYDKGYALWSIDLRKKESKMVGKVPGGGDLKKSSDGKIFLLSKAGLQSIDPASDKIKPISFKAEYEVDKAQERTAMFNHVHKQIQKRFYNINMHGIDWDAMCEAYSKFLPHINNNYDFSELLSELLGELNVSHTGSGYYPSNAKSEPTANLGLLFDLDFDGNGLKVDEIVEKGPFNNKNSKLSVGDIIEKINGQDITVENDYTLLLNGAVGKKTLVSIFRPASGQRWDEVILPISNSLFSELMYKRWVKHRADDVRRWSNGRLGYVHIRSMADASYRDIYSDILGKYNNCDGIVIDIRFNGGGRLHEDIEVLFSGKKYLSQVVRGRKAADMPSRRWNKPSIMLQCEACYSNAHGTPWVYKHMGIGKLVGMPVPGTMTSVNWETLQDSSLYFGIPIIGYQLPDGSYLENKQLEPDIKVANAPETLVKGEDTQLKTAVDQLLRDIDAAR